MIIAIMMAILMIFSVQAHAALDFSEDFESGYADWEENGGCYAYSFQTVTDPCGGTNDVMKVTNIMGDTNEVCTDPSWKSLAGGTCPAGFTCYDYKHRAEIEPKPGGTTSLRVANLEEHWAGWRMYIDPSYPTSSIQSMVVMQTIPSPYNQTDQSFRLHNNGKFRYSVRTSLATESPTTFSITDIEDIRRGVWINLVVHFKRSVDNSGANAGIAEVWVDGVKVVNRPIGRTSQSTDDTGGGGRWKIGEYNGSKIKTTLTGQTYKIYLDDVKIATGTNQYATVAPSTAPGECDPGGDPPPPPPPASFPTQAVLDSFNRANEAPIAGIWTNGITGGGSCDITSSVLTPNSGSTSECYVTSTFNETQEVYATFPNASNHPDSNNIKLFGCLHGGLGASTADGYCLRFREASGQSVGLEVMLNGTCTQITSNVTTSYTNGVKLGMQVQSGGILKAYADTGTGWTEILNRTDPGSPYSCNATNIGVEPNSESHQIDDFGGGAAATSGSSGNELLGGHGGGFMD